MKNSWEIMGGQWEVMWGLWGSWEVSEGSWEFSGGSWEVSEWSLEVSGRFKGGSRQVTRRLLKVSGTPLQNAHCQRYRRTILKSDYSEIWWDPMTNFRNRKSYFGNKISKIRNQISEIRVQKTDLRGQSIELIRGLIKGHRVWCVTIGNVRWHLVEIHDNWCVPWSVRYKGHFRARMSWDPWPSFFLDAHCQQQWASLGVKF